MQLTHKLKNDNRHCYIIEKHSIGSGEYAEIVLPYTKAEQLSSGKPKGFHIQTVRVSNLEEVKIGNGYES